MRNLTGSSFTATYWLNFILVWRQFRRSGVRADPIVIYQMGKVGSSTVEATLQAACPGRQVFHVHDLHRGNIARQLQRKRRYTRGVRPIPKDQSMRLIHETFLERAWQRRSDAAHWQCISLVRDPIAQRVSRFFQYVPSTHAGIVANLPCEEAVERLAADFLAKPRPWTHPFDFFEREMRPVLGVDLGGTKWNPNDRHQIVRGPGFELLVLRTEDLDTNGPVALRQFLDCRVDGLIRRNVTGDKPVAELYAMFQRRFVAPEWCIDWAYDHPLVRRMYSADEIDRFKNRWRDRTFTPVASTA